MSSEVDPLLKEAMSPDDDDDDWMGEQQVEETKSSWFLFLLTFGGLGLQIGWSVETSNGSVSAFSGSESSRGRHGPCM
jgi:solute carrier family 45 protein 1/2/4